MKIPVLFCILFAAITLLLPVFALEPGNAAEPADNPPAPTPGPVLDTSGSAPDLSPPQGLREDLPKLRSSGRFCILDRSSGEVLELSAGEYVRGALAAEMPPSFHPEALKAQAVAAHTYALYCQASQAEAPDPALAGADLSADPSRWEGYVTEEQARERFGENFDLYWGRLCEAAAAVENLVLVYEGEPIVAAYHAISAGETEAAANVWSHGLDYLIPVESPGDKLAPGFETVVSFSAGQTEDILKTAYPGLILPGDKREWLKVLSRSGSGYVLTADAGDIQVSGQDLRTLFGLRSSCFDLSYTLDTFTFTVQGYGHGVGLSQYGADYMARQGSSFQDILAHYYSGSGLAEIIS